MRIAVISRVFSRAAGGAEGYSVALVQKLAQRHDIHVFSQESSQPVMGVTYHRVVCLGRRPRWLNQLVFAFATWLQTRTGFDVVHSHENTWHGQIQTIHVRPIRHNLFFDRHGIRLFQRWVKVALSLRLLTYILLEGARLKGRPSRTVVATSENLRHECEQVYPENKKTIAVILPGTDMPKIKPTRETARHHLGMKQEGVLILFVANDFPRKGLDTVLKALCHLPSDIGLMVVGNPHLAKEYLDLSAQMGLSGRVNFLGSLEDISLAYHSADCLVHPTLEDSFAMVVLEAMAHGLPVIVSGPNHCGISREITDGVEALLLQDPRDAERLAELIGLVLEDSTLAKNLTLNGQRFAEKHSWEMAALQYEALYRKAASR